MTSFNFSCSKWQMHFKKHVKKCLYIKLEGNYLSHFWDIPFCSSYSTSRFSISVITWKDYLYTYLVLCIKFGVSIFIIFGDIKRWIFPTRASIYVQTSFQKPIFRIQGTSKHVNKVKTFHQKFWPNTLFPLSSGSRVIEGKKGQK